MIKKSTASVFTKVSCTLCLAGALLLVVGCTHAPDPDTLFAGTCRDGIPDPCHTIFRDQSEAAKAARAEDFLGRFHQAEARADADALRIEITTAPDGQGSVLRCHGPQTACQQFFDAYQRQP